MDMPYTKDELIDAANALTDEQIEEVGKYFENLAEIENVTQSELNAKVAEFHGISVEAYLSSPNMGKLGELYNANKLQDIVDKLEKALNLSNSAAWAMVLGPMGLLD
jgi:hypothetical protein